MRKKLIPVLLAMTLLVSFSGSVYASDELWTENTKDEINSVINRAVFYKDAILVFTNSPMNNAAFYDDNNNLITSGNTDRFGNVIFNLNGYHYSVYKNHYLKINGVKIYLNDPKVELYNGYFYDENKDDNYDPNDAKKSDKRLFPQVDIVANGYALSGKIKDNPNTDVRIYLNDKIFLRTKTGPDEKFYVKLPRQIRNINMFKFYTDYNSPDSVKLNVWRKSNSEFAVNGYYNPDTRIVGVYEGKVAGETVTSKDGSFTMTTSIRLPANASVDFYIK